MTYMSAVLWGQIGSADFLKRGALGTWADTARAIFDNWLGLIYRTTNLDRRLPFMDGIDPRRPLDGLSE